MAFGKTKQEKKSFFSLRIKKNTEIYISSLNNWISFIFSWFDISDIWDCYTLLKYSNKILLAYPFLIKGIF